MADLGAAEARGFVRIMVVAGEPSGDWLGAHLMAALKLRLTGKVEFVGVGGELMAGQGMISLFPLTELAVMGLLEVLPRAPRLLARLRQTADMARRWQPDVMVTIDSPGFNFRLARRLRDLPTPIVHYVAPQVWAWRPKRAQHLAPLFDHLMTLFPFEPKWFEGTHLATTFVGHPAVESRTSEGEGAAFRAQHGIDAGAPLLALLPGSRTNEVRRHLPVIGETLALLRPHVPDLRAVVPTIGAVAGQVEEMARGWAVPTAVVQGVAAKRAAFAAADAAIAASGTVTLELALAGVPTAIMYRMNPVTGWLAKRLVKVRHVGLPNIVLGREVAPEFLQDRCRPDLLADAIAPHLVERRTPKGQSEAAAELAAALGAGAEAPSMRAADTVLRAMALGRRRGIVPRLGMDSGKASI
jgi:lipid-A-disaccharide synthase